MLVSFLFIAGVILAEFVQVLVDRKDHSSSFFDRSRCDHCKKTVPWYGMIPILGYFLVKGKCIHCNKSISLRYPLFEVIFALLWGISLVFVSGSILNSILFLSFLLLSSYVALSDLINHEVRIDGLTAYLVSFIILSHIVLKNQLDLLSAFAMIAIMVLSVFVIKIAKRGKREKLQVYLGGADWAVLIIVSAFISLQNTTLVLVGALVIIGIISVFPKGASLVKKGIPLLAFVVPLVFVYVLLKVSSIL